MLYVSRGIRKEGVVTNSVFREHDETGAAALMRAGGGSAVSPVPTSVLSSPRIVLLHPWPEVPVRQRFRCTSRQHCSCGYSQPRAPNYDGRRRGKRRCWLVRWGRRWWRRWNRRVWARPHAWIPGSTNSLSGKRNDSDTGSAMSCFVISLVTAPPALELQMVSNLLKRSACDLRRVESFARD